MTELEFLKGLADQIAKAMHDGHWTLLKFTTNWRFGFGTPYEREDIQAMSEGLSAEDAMRKGIDRALADVFHKARCEERRYQEFCEDEDRAISEIIQIETARDIAEKMKEQERLKKVEENKARASEIMKKSNRRKGGKHARA